METFQKTVGRAESQPPYLLPLQREEASKRRARCGLESLRCCRHVTQPTAQPSGLVWNHHCSNEQSAILSTSAPASYNNLSPNRSPAFGRLPVIESEVILNVKALFCVIIFDFEPLMWSFALNLDSALSNNSQLCSSPRRAQ